LKLGPLARKSARYQTRPNPTEPLFDSAQTCLDLVQFDRSLLRGFANTSGLIPSRPIIHVKPFKPRLRNIHMTLHSSLWLVLISHQWMKSFMSHAAYNLLPETTHECHPLVPLCPNPPFIYPHSSTTAYQSCQYSCLSGLRRFCSYFLHQEPAYCLHSGLLISLRTKSPTQAPSRTSCPPRSLTNHENNELFAHGSVICSMVVTKCSPSK